MVKKLSLHALIISVVLALPPEAFADKVSDWNEIGVTAALNAGRGAPAVGIDMAYVHLAIYDAVNAIEGKYSVYAVSPSSAPENASKDAAAAAAAYNVLKWLHPSQNTYLDAQYAASLATIADGPETSAGIGVGEEVAALFIAERTGDGRNAAVSYVPGIGPGYWSPTPPAFAAAGFAWIAYMRPFAMDSPSQFRPEPPPSLNSAEWAEDFNEIKTMGSLDSVHRSPEQTEIGRFYLDNANVQNARGFRALAAAKGMEIGENARLFAMLYASLADGLIGSFDAKFHYNFWRPVTAIRNADLDGNPDTEAGPNWLPLAATPPFPDYLAAHSALTSAYAEALRNYFGTKKLHFVLTSTTTGTTHEFHNIDDVVKEVNDARVWSGFHYRTSDVRGAVLGRKVGKWVARNYFQPTTSKRDSRSLRQIDFSGMLSCRCQ